MRLVTYDEVKNTIQLDDDLVDAIERGFVIYSQRRCTAPEVMHLEIRQDSAFHLRSGYNHGDSFCVAKVASTFFDNPKRNQPKPAISGLHMAFETETGDVLAVFDDRAHITNLRTAAGGAIAARYLARKNAQTVGIVGLGVQGLLQLQAMLKYTDASRALVYRRTTDLLAQQVEELSEQYPGIRIEAAASVEELVRSSDIVATCTPSESCLFEADWLKPGTLVYGMGADSRRKREIPFELFTSDRTRVIVDSLSQNEKLAEIGIGIREELFDIGIVESEIGDVISDESLRRSSDDEIIICKSTGVAVQDIATCKLLMEKLGILEGEKD